MDELNKKTVLVLLVIAVVLSVVATWKVLTTTQPDVYVANPQHGTVSLTVVKEPQSVTSPPPVTKGGSVSLVVEDNTNK